MEKEKVLSNIEHTGVIAVIRAQSSGQALNMAENCLKGGIDIIELAFTTPSPLAALETLKKRAGRKNNAGRRHCSGRAQRQRGNALRGRFYSLPSF